MGTAQATEVFSANPDELTASSLLGPLLVNRLLEVVSNTAAVHNLPTPVWLTDKDAGKLVRDFFAQNPQIKPVDPWLAELRRQKID